MFAAIGLKHEAAFGFEQHSCDGKTDGVVINGKYAAGGGGPGNHVGRFYTLIVTDSRSICAALTEDSLKVP